VPANVLGRPVPGRFRGLAARFRDPDRQLVDFIGWLESERVDAPEPRTSSIAAPDDADRAALVAGTIEVLDRESNEALRESLLRSLAAAGVEAVSADGERFDAQRHQAIHALDTPDPSLEGTIASTERLGFVDRSGEVLRLPEVTVYRRGS
jgi:hypothetical protein